MNHVERLPTILSGIAGQYFVAAEVSRRGYIATLTLRNTRGVDMLVACSDASKSVGIQVKTNQGSSKVWLLDKKAEESATENLVYVFVNLNNDTESKTPQFHVVPSHVVAEFAHKYHQTWLAGTKKNGDERKDGSMRKFRDPTSAYRDQWHYLGL